MIKRLGSAIAAVSALSIMLAGCGGTALPGSEQTPGGKQTVSAPALPPVEADAALFDKLPKRVQDTKQIKVGVDATYKPNEYLDTDGKTVIGMNVDLFDLVAQRLGVTTEWQPSAFDQILVGIEARKYDAGVSSFTINEERMKTVIFVEYLNAGSQWAIPAGNPKQLDPKNLCGQTVAVQTGTVQEVEMKDANAKCPPDNQIDVLSFQDQGEVNNALMSGRAAGMTADSPISFYAISQSDGKLEALGEVYDAAPYGVALNKEDREFAEAISAAFQAVKDSGHYDAVLAKWGQEKSGVSAFPVKP